MPRLDTPDKLFMCVRCVQTPHGSSWTLPLRVILVPPSSPMVLPQSAQSVCKPSLWCCSCYCCSAVLSRGAIIKTNVVKLKINIIAPLGAVLSLSVSFCSPTPYESKTRSTLALLGLMHADIFTDRLASGCARKLDSCCARCWQRLSRGIPSRPDIYRFSFHNSSMSTCCCAALGLSTPSILFHC